MPLSSLLLLFALLVLVALFVARPLFAPDATEDTETPNELSPWIAERERVLDALAELDTDWQLGKVPEELYSGQRQQLVAKGAIAIRQLERLGESPKKTSIRSDDAQLEKMIAARRAKREK
jgi:hypothetical protein